METTTNSTNFSIADAGLAKGRLSSFFSKREFWHEEEVLDYATIDGGVITSNSVRQAVDSGAGIFIGGYFVGVTDNFFAGCNTPYVRY